MGLSSTTERKLASVTSIVAMKSPRALRAGRAGLVEKGIKMNYTEAARRQNPRARPGSGALAVAPEDLFLDLLEARVAHVLALHEIDDVLTNIAGMIANALERPRGPDDVERARDGARVLHHERNHLAHHAL